MFWIFALLLLLALASILVGLPLAIGRWFQLSSGRYAVGLAILLSVRVRGPHAAKPRPQRP